ncbi:hypothetical protein [Leifsonia poae]|uniref:hypothetical protein n=1 Tax=Leifsonia poae TaxID=110933 RepID=UPI001CBACAF7|nr:hypothetical protein [Leifsonia poae]
MGGEGDTSEHYDVWLRNGNNVPIYDLYLMVNGYGELAARGVVDLDQAVVPPGFEQVFALLPYSEAQRTRGPKVVDGEIDLRGHEPWDFLVELRFRDADGVTWKRSENGEISEGGSRSKKNKDL